MKYALLFLSVFLSFSTTTQAQTAELNPNFFYLVKGQVIGPRGISLGDPDNWSVQVQNREGKSETGKIAVTPTDFKAKDDAIKITWAARKPVKGTLGIYGATAIDLSSFKNAATLVVDMRIDTKPDKNVTIGMDCTYPCVAEIIINESLKSPKKGEWFSLPLPLNCFKNNNFDLSKITGPFTIATEGKFAVSIANVRIEKLGEGEKGCAE
jgi:Galactose-binding domain-like